MFYNIVFDFFNCDSLAVERNGIAAPWARAANLVKKPPLIANVTYLKINGFDASIWVS